MRRGGLVLAVLVALVGSGAARAAVTQPPAPFDPRPLDGDTYYLVNQASGKQLDASAGTTARSFSDLGQRWAVTKAPSGNWMISNVATGRCLDATSTTRCAGAPSQQWTFSYLSNGYSTITNVATGNPLDVGGTKWLPRATFWRGNDSSLQSKAEADREFANNANAPWWHDAYLPGQDLLQILKNSGFNMVRVRPASINTTVVHDGVSFPITTAPYNNYTLAPPPASQIIPASANAASPGGTSSGNHAQTDWSAVDLAVRAKRLGMSVNVTLFYSGDSTAETPGNWAGKTVDQIAAVPGPMYDYVKQEMLLFKANGAWPDLVSIGNEVNTGMFNTTGANGLSPSGTNCTPTATGGGTGTANCFPRIQRAAMQAIADAATDTSAGPALPAPLTCIHVDGNPDLQRFFAGATQTNGIPLDVACESYYPGWHGPLTQRQQDWHPCNAASCGSTVPHVAQQDFATEAHGLRLARPAARRAGLRNRGKRPRPADLHDRGRRLLHDAGQPAGSVLRRQPARAVAQPLAPGDDRPLQGRAEHPEQPQPRDGVVGRRGDDDPGRDRRPARDLDDARNRALRRVHDRWQSDQQRHAAGDGRDGRPARSHPALPADQRRDRPGAGEPRWRRNPRRGARHGRGHRHHRPAPAVADPRPGRRPGAERHRLSGADGPSRRRLLPDRQPERAAGPRRIGHDRRAEPADGRHLRDRRHRRGAGVGRADPRQLRRHPGQLRGAAAGVRRRLLRDRQPGDRQGALRRHHGDRAAVAGRALQRRLDRAGEQGAAVADRARPDQRDGGRHQRRRRRNRAGNPFADAGSERVIRRAHSGRGPRLRGADDGGRALDGGRRDADRQRPRPPDQRRVRAPAAAAGARRAEDLRGAGLARHRSHRIPPDDRRERRAADRELLHDAHVHAIDDDALMPRSSPVSSRRSTGPRTASRRR